MQRNILSTYLHHLLSFKKMNSHYVVFSHSSFCILHHATTCTKHSHACFIKHEQISQRSVHTSHSLGKRIMDEIVHYYHGFRLLGINLKVAYPMVSKILQGGELSRREHKHLMRTVSDIFRLVPFSVFILVPFMELLLPVFIKLFPQMLPSTFESASEQEKKLKGGLKIKLEMAKFLQGTLDELSVKENSHSVKEFSSVSEKIRLSGEVASNEMILKYCKLFEDELTLDNLPRPSLIALCRLLELSPIGTNNLLRFQLRMRLRNLKYDDKMIIKDGIHTLTVKELQSACHARGMRSIGLSEERLKTQLKEWMELSLNKDIPPSLLLLSRILYLPAPDQLKDTAVKSGTIFDNILITDDEAEAEKHGQDTWGAIKEAEKKMKEKLDEEEKKTAEAKVDVAEEDAGEDEKADSENIDGMFEVQKELHGDLVQEELHRDLVEEELHGALEEEFKEEVKSAS